MKCGTSSTKQMSASSQAASDGSPRRWRHSRSKSRRISKSSLTWWRRACGKMKRCEIRIVESPIRSSCCCHVFVIAPGARRPTEHPGKTTRKRTALSDKKRSGGGYPFRAKWSAAAIIAHYAHPKHHPEIPTARHDDADRAVTFG